MEKKQRLNLPVVTLKRIALVGKGVVLMKTANAILVVVLLVVVGVSLRQLQRLSVSIPALQRVWQNSYPEGSYRIIKEDVVVRLLGLHRSVGHPWLCLNDAYAHKCIHGQEQNEMSHNRRVEMSP